MHIALFFHALSTSYSSVQFSNYQCFCKLHPDQELLWTVDGIMATTDVIVIGYCLHKFYSTGFWDWPSKDGSSCFREMHRMTKGTKICCWPVALNLGRMPPWVEAGLLGVQNYRELTINSFRGQVHSFFKKF